MAAPSANAARTKSCWRARAFTRACTKCNFATPSRPLALRSQPRDASDETAFRSHGRRAGRLEILEIDDRLRAGAGHRPRLDDPHLRAQRESSLPRFASPAAGGIRGARAAHAPDGS